MEPSMNNFSGPEKIPTPSFGIESTSPEIIEFEPKFNQHQEDLKYMFNINVDNEQALSSKETKDKMYEKIVEDFNEGKPFALDYMFEERLLTKEDLLNRGILSYKNRALEILAGLRSTGTYNQTKRLFENIGII